MQTLELVVAWTAGRGPSPPTTLTFFHVCDVFSLWSAFFIKLHLRVDPKDKSQSLFIYNQCIKLLTGYMLNSTNGGFCGIKQTSPSAPSV